MSILIKGMKMPESCYECRFCEGDTMDGRCYAADKWFDDDRFTWATYEEGDIDDSKPTNCPLIELPPHGRLIDADALTLYTLHYRRVVLEEDILLATTVIEAESAE